MEKSTSIIFRALLLMLLLAGSAAAQIVTGGGGSSSASGLPPGIISPSNPTTLCLGCVAKADAQGVTDATVTNGSNAITTGGGDPAFTSADTGKDCFATAGGGSGVVRFNGRLAMTEGTFTQTGAHTGTCSGTSNANATGTNTNFFFWATNDTAAMTAAWTAASPATGTCRSILLSGSAMLVTSNFGSSAAGNCGFNLGGAKEGIGMAGNSFGSIIIIGPNFDFTTCTGGVSSNVCLFAQSGLYLNSLVIYGAERADCPVAANNKILVGINGDSIYDVVQLIGWCSSNANGSTTIGLAPASTGGVSTNYINVDGFGFTCIASSNYPIRMSSWFAGDCQGGDLSITGGFFTSSDGFAADTGGVGGNIIVQGAGTVFISTGDACVVFSPTVNIGLRVETGAIANITNMFCNVSVATTGSALWVNGGTVNVSNSIFKGGSSTGQDVFLDAGGHFNNLGGNQFLQGHIRLSATGIYSGSGAFTGVGQGTCTAGPTTLGMYGLGQLVNVTCGPSTVTNLGQVAVNSGTVYGIICISTVAGVGAGSGVCTALKNNVTQATTCTIGTGTSCGDNTGTVFTHLWAFNQGDVISCQVATLAAETLAGVKCVLFGNYI